MSRVEILLPRDFQADLVTFITATSVILGPLVVLCPTEPYFRLFITLRVNLA